MIKVNGKEVLFELFPNGETKLIQESIEQNLALMYPEINFKYESDLDLIKLLFVKNYLDSIGIADKQTSLLIYYMPYSRMDRSENNSPFTLKYVAHFINELRFKRVTVIEPHSDITCALLDRVEAKYINFDLLPVVKESISFDETIDYFFFPDAGASKRYQTLRGLKELVGYKKRDFTSGRIESLQIVGDFVIDPALRPPNALIIDDLSSYGGTFVRSAKALKELGFQNVYLLIAHAENVIFKGELFDHIAKVFTTDSILTEQNNWENKKFAEQLEVYKLEDIL